MESDNSKENITTLIDLMEEQNELLVKIRNRIEWFFLLSVIGIIGFVIWLIFRISIGYY